MKKRLMIIGLTMLFILTSIITSYAATEPTVTLQPNKTEVKAGETFTVTLSATCEDGINNVDTTYTYDTEKLELISANVADNNFVNLGIDNQITAMSNTTETITSADIYVLTFKVKDDVEVDSTATVSISETILDSDAATDSEHTIPAQEVTITVIGEDDSEVCEHTYEWKHDNTHHWEECTKCNEIKTGSREAHVYGEYTDNGDGTHSSTCTVCNYKLTENHNIADGKCTQCNAVAPETGDDDEKPTQTPDEDKPTTDGTTVGVGEDKKDPTVADKDIPKAGINAMIIIAIIAASIGAIVIYRKNQSYRDIK